MVLCVETVCCVTKFEMSLSIALSVVDVVVSLTMVIFYKLKGVDLTIKMFLYSFGCLLTALTVFFWIIYAPTSPSCLRLSLIYVIGGLSSGSLFWKLFSILFVILHRIALHCTNNPCILKRANPLRCTRSTNHEVVERDLSLMTVEEIGRNTSDQPLRHQRGSVEIQPYAEINLLPFQSTIELQHNVAYAGVGVQYYCLPGARKSKMTDKSGLQMHPEVLELQENVAYQRPSELRECSDIPVYEIIN